MGDIMHINSLGDDSLNQKPKRLVRSCIKICFCKEMRRDRMTTPLVILNSYHYVFHAYVGFIILSHFIVCLGITMLSCYWLSLFTWFPYIFFFHVPPFLSPLFVYYHVSPFYFFLFEVFSCLIIISFLICLIYVFTALLKIIMCNFFLPKC